MQAPPVTPEPQPRRAGCGCGRRGLMGLPFVLFPVTLCPGRSEGRAFFGGKVFQLHRERWSNGLGWKDVAWASCPWNHGRDARATGALKFAALGLRFRGAGPNSYHVLRGGSWNNNPTNCRSANRNRNNPTNRGSNNGVCAIFEALVEARYTGGPGRRLVLAQGGHAVAFVSGPLVARASRP